MKIKAPRGTQDILPGVSRGWEWVEGTFREVLHRYGFAELRTPLFESTELFTRGVGEATDIVQKEMYTFTDRKGRSLTLRPEGTASAARAYTEHSLFNEPQPVKVFYMGPMFRYERPQAGRYRQHQQVGAEIFGAAGPEADFEAMVLMLDMFHAVGLRHLTIKLNSVGDAACRPAYTQALREYLQKRAGELNDDMRRQVEMNPLRALDSKDPKAKQLVADAPSIQEFLNEACREHQGRLLDLLNAAGAQVELDPRLVRGLDYYTKTVFEIQHGGLGAQSAVGGGGRYDGLVGDVGGPDTPAVGFSTGVERILMALQADGAPVPGAEPPQVAVVGAGQGEVTRAAQVLARRLRSRFRTAVDLMGRGLGGQMKSAGKAGAPVVILVGGDELEAGTWTVKIMATGEQQAVSDADLETYVKQVLESGKAT